MTNNELEAVDKAWVVVRDYLRKEYGGDACGPGKDNAPGCMGCAMERAVSDIDFMLSEFREVGE